MAVLQYKDPVTGQLKDLPLINQGIKEAPIDGKQYARKDGEWSEIEVDGNVDLSGYTTNEELNNALLGKVDKQEGKQLTTEDFTTVLKEKLEGLSNYNDTEIRNAIDSLESAFNTLMEGNATVAIDTFNEIVAFLKNIENSQDLDSIIAGINTTISKVEAKIPDTNNLLSKDGGTMNNTNLVGNLNADMLDGLHIDEFLIKGPRVYSREDFDTKYRFASIYSTDYMSPVDGACNYGQVLSFVDNCSTTQFYCPDNTGLIYFRNSWGTDSKGSENFANIPWYEIITSKNIGSQTVSNSDMLDGYHESAFLRYRGGTSTDQESTLWDSLGIKQYVNALPDGLTDVYNYGEVISLIGTQARFDMYVAHTSTNTDYEHGIWVRSGWVDDKKPWRRLAFISDTVAAANKLSTTRYLWGQSFDGSGDVYGDLKSIDGYNFVSTTSNHVLFGYGYAQNNKTVFLDGSPIYFRYGTNHNVGMILNSNGNVTIGTDDFASSNWKLYVNGNVFHNGVVSTNNFIRLYGKTNVSSDVYLDNTTYSGLNIRSNSSSYMLIGSNVGIGTTNPQATLDVNGDVAIRGITSVTGVYLNGSDQINGKFGLSLNYSCGEYVNTSIWDGQNNLIMRVFGEYKRVAIGANAIESPQGRLNVDGDVIFENSRFITTSGFTGGDYSYSHAIYGGYHGIDVCEFYENEFRFKTNGGDTTSFTLNRYYADFNGTVRTYNCDFTGVHWNGNTRFRLIRDGESSTWLQAGTDTTAENGDLYMSGLHGNLLRQFNVWTSVSNFKGSIIAEGDVTAYSDIRLKNRIETVSNVLDTINNLDVFRYTWKNREDKSVHIGVSAQQVQNIYPEFVLASSSEDGTDYLTVNYAALATCIAIQGIKELVKKGDERDKIIAALKEEVISLKEQLRYGNK